MRLLSLLACAAAAACAVEQPADNRVAEQPVETAARNAPAISQSPPAGAPAREVDPAAPAHPCLLADGRALTTRLKAIGTEPFWAAEVRGRCVTYKTPDDQAGTRVWARFRGTDEAGEWSGFLGERRFLLVTRAQPGCSDGMSDKRYSLAATVKIGDEELRGCAEPL